MISAVISATNVTASWASLFVLWKMKFCQLFVSATGLGCVMDWPHNQAGHVKDIKRSLKNETWLWIHGNYEKSMDICYAFMHWNSCRKWVKLWTWFMFQMINKRDVENLIWIDIHYWLSGVWIIVLIFMIHLTKGNRS